MRRAPDRHVALCDAMHAMYRHRLAAHGFADVENKLALLAMDVEFNAQGLACWLDRESRY